jgi:hypothetical protein
VTRQFLSGNQGTLDIIKDGDLLEKAILEFVEVYNQSWKKKEPSPEFIPNLLRVFASRGWLRLGIATRGNTPVAGQIWFVCQDTAYICKLAYRNDFK